MSKVILCADDSVTMQTVAEITFRATEFGYAGARTVDEAIDKVKAQRPALVLADALMPGKTGYDLCHALKSDPATADIPVVILCGNSAPFDAARGGQVGADGSLTKPWDTQVMLDKVVEILDKVAASGVAKAAGRGAAIQAPAPVAAPTPVAPPAPIAPPPVVQVPAAAAQPKVAPPRSATIMGMPTIKMPGPAPAPTPAPAPVPVAAAPVAPAPRPASSTGPIASPATVRGIAPITTPPAPASTAPVAQFTTARVPMISGVPTKRSALVEHTLAKMGERLAELSGLTPGSAELTALVKLSSEIVERVVWEVVPELAETIIREHVAELAKRQN